ncbi:MAG TPA: DUF3048 domain-containing protein [Jatrophihabitans sp.]|jgi:hypothetical protein|nr:DUF3048 domain-containing protein [Jatrophihabitans sp.]
MIAGLSKAQALIAGGAAAVVVIGGVSALALRGDDGKKNTAAPASSTPATTSSAAPSPTPRPSATPTPKPPAPPPVNPLTGIGKPPAGPILAVKVDDTANGRPSRGLDKADVVYIEQAEGGLTRLVAVFGTHKPVVEPVRSVRASDPELLSQYGPITLVASGGAGDSMTTLDRSPIRGVINDRGGPGFSRDANRPAPYNVQSDLAVVSASVRTAGSRNVGFGWATSDPRVKAAPATAGIRTAVGSTSVTFDWEPTIGKYARTIGGAHLHAADGALIATPNVLVQLCSVTVNYRDVDVMGNPSQYTHSVGSGRVVLFRNGHRIEGKWSRPSASAPTRFTDLKGKPLLLAPGGAYVVLASKGAPV